MNRFMTPHFSRTRRRGAALLITLALLVLLTAIVLAFFSRVTDSGKATVVASSQTEVNLLTKSALDVVLGDLRTEMLSGSTVKSAQNYLWMKPNATAAWSPYRQVKSAVSTDTNFPNVVKQSVSAVPFFPTGAPYGALRPTILGASAVSTSEPSADKHVFSPARWDLPALITGSFAATQAPDWIYVTRSGVPQTQAYAPGSKDPKSSDAILGRFAFNIYDISGLLDINVAGHPVATVARAPDKGGLPWSALETNVSVAGADVPLVSPGASLLNWRNASSVTNYEDYVRLQGLEKGFLTHNHGDRMFDTRSDLIRYANRAGSPIDPQVLPWLTTFSRTVNTPSWTPVNPTGSTVDYASAVDQAASSNRDISGVRVLTEFTRRDGTTAKIGEPLIKTRFPLGRIDLLRGTDTTNIAKYFGLSRSGTSSPWQPDLLSGRIRTLAEVAQENREPNFFELIKAGILSGAMGGHNSGQSLLTNYESDISIDRQVLQIGANLIDQYDEDSVPTWISTLNLANDGGTTGDAFGVENHPMISAMYQMPVRRHDLGSTGSVKPGDALNPYAWVSVYLQFQIWNPHLNVASAPGGEYRIVATAGQSRISVEPPRAGVPAPETLTGSAIYFGAGGSGLNVTEPQLLNADRISTTLTSPQNIYTANGAKVAGLHLGRVDASHNQDNDGNNSNDFSYLSAPFDAAARLQVQWKSPGGDWVTVQEVGPLSSAVTSGSAFQNNKAFDPADLYTNAVKVDTSYFFSDPRSRRYGVHGKDNPGTVPSLADQSLRPAGATPAYGKTAFANFNSSPFWSISGISPGYAPAELAENDASSSATVVRGTDGVSRLADSTKAQNVFASGSNGRPFVLNRPFRSVGEMAYAFRDEPWKSVDFFTDKSGDAGLLELFSVNEAPVQAGVININRADPGVMEALLAQALRDPAISSSGALDAKSIAAAIRQTLGPVNNPTLPLTGRADLPKVIQTTALTGFDHKRQREVLARTFGDVINVRTWNLLIDLVVQSGKIGASGSSLSDFAMRAERRVWAQVAIDRVTGEVVDIQVETVNE